MKRVLFIILALVCFIPSHVCAVTVTTLTLKEKDGVTTSNYPITFGHVFKKGDVTQYVTASYDGTPLTTQCDVKTTYDDGSVRFAVISFVIPSVAANGTKNIVLSTSATTSSNGYLDKAAILATSIEDEIRITSLSGSGYSDSLTADLNAKITSDSSPTYWLQGSVATEILVQQGLNNSLEAAWEVRYYPGTSFGPRVSHSIENVNANYRGSVSYDVDIQAGMPSLSSRYTKSSVPHNENSRLRKVIWIGTEPPETELHYDLTYLISTGAVMNYDTSITVPEATIASSYSMWLSSSRDIMGNGVIEKAMPMTGGRDDLGVLPAWTTRYLLSMDNRTREIMLNAGELAGSAPVHFRESDSGKSAYRHPISIDDRDTVWTNDNGDARSSTFGDVADRLPTAIGTTNASGWNIDVAHQPSLALIPYIVTGEHYFLRELQYWGAYNLSACDSHPDYGRNYAAGIINPDPREVRGVAWALRTIGDAAAFSVDTDPEKTYLAGKVENNFDYLYSVRSVYPLTHLYASTLTEDLDANVTRAVSPWMMDFVILAISHLHDLGFTNASAKVLQYYGTFIINRFTHPDFNHYNGATYRFPAETTGGIKVSSWSQASDLYASQPTSFPTITAGTSKDAYHFYALAALSVVDKYITGGQGKVGRDFLLGEIENAAYHDILASDTRFAIIPSSGAPIQSSGRRYRYLSISGD